ncbi:MAG: homoserine dehydrogenase [Firmicutes bacterium]|nr:homoserine dehydrogenase [Bacillota bacterium]
MNIAIIGYGGVGKALTALIEKQKDVLAKEHLHINISYIIGRGDDPSKAAADPALDLAVILTPTNKDTGQPGLDYARMFLSAGKHVVSADKGLVIHGLKELQTLAHKNQVHFAIGCTTGGALPSVNGGLIDMAGSQITSIEGILNGTTNFILKYMEEQGCSYEEALAIAQRDGIAETDPTLDVEGWDTASKILILANLLMDAGLTLDDVEVEGITHLRASEIQEAAGAGEKYKLVGQAETSADGKVTISVGPKRISSDSLLYQVDGKNKAVRYLSDTLGELVIMGGASGTTPAAASVLRDIVNIHRQIG